MKTVCTVNVNSRLTPQTKYKALILQMSALHQVYKVSERINLSYL